MATSWLRVLFLSAEIAPAATAASPADEVKQRLLSLRRRPWAEKKEAKSQSYELHA